MMVLLSSEKIKFLVFIVQRTKNYRITITNVSMQKLATECIQPLTPRYNDQHLNSLMFQHIELSNLLIKSIRNFKLTLTMHMLKKQLT